MSAEEEGGISMAEANTLAKELIRLKLECNDYKAALEVVAVGTCCPELFPHTKDMNEVQARTAMTAAFAVLDKHGWRPPRRRRRSK